jgi:hypothetical protein
MKLLAKLPIAVLLALAVVPAEARAGWKIDRAQTIAATVWRYQPPVTLRWARLPAPAMADASTATVWLNIGPREDSEWAPFCTTMIHEYGHLAGFRDPSNVADPQHSHNPRSVMFGGAKLDRHTVHVLGGATTTTWVGMDPRCRDRGRPYLMAHGLLTSRSSRP